MTLFGDTKYAEPVYERIAPTKWREVTPDQSPAQLASALPPLGPDDETALAAACKDSALIREAAYAAGQAGMPLDAFLMMMELPQSVGPALRADLERGRAHTMLAMARVVTSGALKGDGKLLQYWLKARGGTQWQDTKPAEIGNAGGPSLTQIVINTGVPLPPDENSRDTLSVSLTKKDYEHIPELRE